MNFAFTLALTKQRSSRTFSKPSKYPMVLKALTRKFQLHKDVSLLSVAKMCPPNFTGADMYALCADAWFHAAKLKVVSNHSADSPNSEEKSNSVVVEFDDFVKNSWSCGN
uniref:AAA ATPase AAA+ lid domain-containing protein n=1 Tax=Ananas comosus var. bracteatus TaxID=296719 RepID=A0A6V7NJL4_ANACO|nr:unnamed protein product [Ananas comosus var. bracteatus]